MGAFLEDDALRNALLELCLHRPSQESVFISQTVLTLPRDRPWAPSSSTAAVGGGRCQRGSQRVQSPALGILVTLYKSLHILIAIPLVSVMPSPTIRAMISIEGFPQHNSCIYEEQKVRVTRQYRRDPPLGSFIPHKDENRYI